MTALERLPTLESSTPGIDPVDVAADQGDVVDEMIEINGGQLHLRADHVHWHTIAEAHNIAAGYPMRFTTDFLVGYLSVTSDSLVAVVAVCSRCGCLLQLDGGSQWLRCPASGAVYGPNGRVLNPAGHYRPAPLTRLHARLIDGHLQALVPGMPVRADRLQ
jgi:Rieske Fe-S protein